MDVKHLDDMTVLIMTVYRMYNHTPHHHHHPIHYIVIRQRYHQTIVKVKAPLRHMSE